jgi:hypothetical protein
MPELESNKQPSTEFIVKVLIDNQMENSSFIRHYEDVRFKITQVTITLAGLLIGASRFTSQTAMPPSKLPIALFIIVLGVIGILISAKYSERADRHAVISRAYRRAASNLIGKIQGHDLEEIHSDAAALHANAWSLTSFLYPIRARYFWLAVHACIVLLGILVAFI